MTIRVTQLSMCMCGEREGKGGRGKETERLPHVHETEATNLIAVVEIGGLPELIGYTHPLVIKLSFIQTPPRALFEGA